MTWLNMWSFHLRNQIYIIDGGMCFDYDLQVPSHGISKISCIGYDMKSTKMIMWSRWDYPPSVYKEIDSRNEMR